jgi:DNA-binding response OmpR family regulator
MPFKILIVDDEPNIVIPLQFLMEQNGYEVMAAQSGEEGLEIIYRHKPDLVLLDIMLPGIDGYEICEIIRLKPELRHIKMIFLTAKGRDINISKGLALGADAYITKPFSNAELVKNVKMLLNDVK